MVNSDSEKANRPPDPRNVPNIRVVAGDIFAQTTDTLCVLHAANVPRLLWRMVDHGIVQPSVPAKSPEVGGATLMRPLSAMGASRILLVETPEENIDYKDIFNFGQGTIRALARHRVDPVSIAMILHGPGYGLDTDMCFAQLLAGLRGGLVAHGSELPSLTEILVVEQQANRRDRMEKRINKLWMPMSPTSTKSAAHAPRPPQRASKHIFVAMPFTLEFTDTWEYGFYNPAKDAECVCERCDRAIFDGDILDWMKDRIRRADLVIAEISTVNPNVYLQIGYAWGLGKPTLLVSRESEALKPEMRSQRCITYKTIKELENAIRSHLQLHLR